MEKLIIDKKLAEALHNYISTSPTGRHDFSHAYELLAAIEKLTPLKVSDRAPD